MKQNLFDLTGRTALVTGASSGFGAHFACTMAAQGARVALAARRMDKLESLVAQIRSEGGQAMALEMDVTDSQSVLEGFNRIESDWSTVDLVSNNAGVADTRRAQDIDEASWDYVLDTNLKGMWRVASESGRRMIAANQPGSIVNTASILGLRVARGHSSYATSKAAVIQLTRSLALEWTRYKIRVNALCPGYFVTEINRDFLESDKGRAFVHSTPARRTGQMDEITAPFLLLASQAGSFINGVALPVDGAHHLGNM